MKVVSINTIRDGGREQVEIGVNLRLPSGLPVADILKSVQRPVAGARWEIVDHSEAVEVDPRNEVVSALCAGIREQRGRPTLLRKLGTSDLNLAVPAWECPAAAYGPGDSHLDHTDEENLPIVDFQRSIAVLEIAFSRLTNRDVTKVPVVASQVG